MAEIEATSAAAATIESHEQEQQHESETAASTDETAAVVGVDAEADADVDANPIEVTNTDVDTDSTLDAAVAGGAEETTHEEQQLEQATEEHEDDAAIHPIATEADAVEPDSDVNETEDAVASESAPEESAQTVEVDAEDEAAGAATNENEEAAPAEATDDAGQLDQPAASDESAPEEVASIEATEEHAETQEEEEEEKQAESHNQEAQPEDDTTHDINTDEIEPEPTTNEQGEVTIIEAEPQTSELEVEAAPSEQPDADDAAPTDQEATETVDSDPAATDADDTTHSINAGEFEPESTEQAETESAVEEAQPKAESVEVEAAEAELPTLSTAALISEAKDQKQTEVVQSQEDQPDPVTSKEKSTEAADLSTAVSRTDIQEKFAEEEDEHSLDDDMKDEITDRLFKRTPSEIERTIAKFLSDDIIESGESKLKKMRKEKVEAIQTLTELVEENDGVEEEKEISQKSVQDEEQKTEVVVARYTFSDGKLEAEPVPSAATESSGTTVPSQHQPEEETLLTDPTEEEEAAIIRIQAMHRGKKERKNFIRQKTALKETDSISTTEVVAAPQVEATSPSAVVEANTISKPIVLLPAVKERKRTPPQVVQQQPKVQEETKSATPPAQLQIQSLTTPLTTIKTTKIKSATKALNPVRAPLTVSSSSTTDASSSSPSFAGVSAAFIPPRAGGPSFHLIPYGSSPKLHTFWIYYDRPLRALFQRYAKASKSRMRVEEFVILCMEFGLCADPRGVTSGVNNKQSASPTSSKYTRQYHPYTVGTLTPLFHSSCSTVKYSMFYPREFQDSLTTIAQVVGQRAGESIVEKLRFLLEKYFGFDSFDAAFENPPDKQQEEQFASTLQKKLALASITRMNPESPSKQQQKSSVITSESAGIAVQHHHHHHHINSAAAAGHSSSPNLESRAETLVQEVKTINSPDGPQSIVIHHHHHYYGTENKKKGGAQTKKVADDEKEGLSSSSSSSPTAASPSSHLTSMAANPDRAYTHALLTKSGAKNTQMKKHLLQSLSQPALLPGLNASVGKNGAVTAESKDNSSEKTLNSSESSPSLQPPHGRDAISITNTAQQRGVIDRKRTVAKQYAAKRSPSPKKSSYARNGVLPALQAEQQQQPIKAYNNAQELPAALLATPPTSLHDPSFPQHHYASYASPYGAQSIVHHAQAMSGGQISVHGDLPKTPLNYGGVGGGQSHVEQQHTAFLQQQQQYHQQQLHEQYLQHQQQLQHQHQPYQSSPPHAYQQLPVQYIPMHHAAHPQYYPPQSYYLHQQQLAASSQLEEQE